MAQLFRIENERGSTAATSHGKWGYARENLQSAARAIAGMEGAPDRLTYERCWRDFLHSTEEFWTSFFDEGKQHSSNFKAWGKKQDRIRRRDETVMYCIQARGVSQHSRLQLSWSQPRLVLFKGPGGFFEGGIGGITIYRDGTYETKDEHPTSANKMPFPVEKQHGQPSLPEIQNRGVVFAPPTKHRDAALPDRSPIAVCRVVLAYYEELLRDAATRF